MGVGKRDRRVRGAVEEAEASTGLQFCVYLGPATDDPRELAERLFLGAEHEGQHPAVLLAVCTTQHRVEILTADWVRERIPDASCDTAIELMRPALRSGAYDEALVTAIGHLASVAGTGDRRAGGVELPDFFDERER